MIKKIYVRGGDLQITYGVQKEGKLLFDKEGRILLDTLSAPILIERSEGKFILSSANNTPNDAHKQEFLSEESLKLEKEKNELFGNNMSLISRIMARIKLFFYKTENKKTDNKKAGSNKTEDKKTS